MLASTLASIRQQECSHAFKRYCSYYFCMLASMLVKCERGFTNTLLNLNTTSTQKLHWLPIKLRIDYKLKLLTYKMLKIQQPTYLYNSLSFPSHSLSTRSSDSSVLSIPYVRTSLGKRAFSVIAPRLWNSLPPDTRNSLSLSTFRSKLKTHLFNLTFPLNSLPSYHRTAYPDLILVFPLLLALSSDTWC